MHEASLYDQNCFITLTFNDDNLPIRGQLDYKIFQKFIKRLIRARSYYVDRKRVSPKQRFFACGEYGGETGRPHFHALLFDYDFPDKKKIRQLDSGCTVYRSELLERLWPFGMSSIGNLTFESAAYVARYCIKKVTGKAAGPGQHYTRWDEFGEYELTPEMGNMSRRPGIGAKWLEKFHTDVFPNDYVVVGGLKLPVPRYYDKLYEGMDLEDMDFIKFDRMIAAEKYLDDNTPERLADRETVEKARVNMFKRDME